MWREKYRFDGTRVKVAALKAQVSLRKLAKEFGVPYGTVLRWLNGRNVPPIFFAHFLKKRLNLDVGEIVHEVPTLEDGPAAR